MNNSLWYKFGVAAALLMPAWFPQSAIAQTASNLVCNGCVNSKDIKDQSIGAKDLAANVFVVDTVMVPAKGKAAENCKRLRQALNKTAASASSPAVLKLQGGKYNCRTTALVLKPFVTIEGAGRNATTIFGDVNGFDQAVIQAVRDSHLRNLTVRHRAVQATTANVVRATGARMTMSDVAVEIDSDIPNSATGIFVVGGNLALTNVSVRSKAGNGQSQGIRGESGSRLEMMSTWVHNESGAFGNPAALELRDTSTATGYGILFSSNVFGILGRGTSSFSLVDGTIIGGRGTADSPTFSCVAIADADFTARGADCS